MYLAWVPQVSIFETWETMKAGTKSCCQEPRSLFVPYFALIRKITTTSSRTSRKVLMTSRTGTIASSLLFGGANAGKAGGVGFGIAGSGGMASGPGPGAGAGTCGAGAIGGRGGVFSGGIGGGAGGANGGRAGGPNGDADDDDGFAGGGAGGVLGNGRPNAEITRVNSPGPPEV